MNLRISILGLIALCVAVFVPVIPVKAQQQDSALLDALVKKGVLSDQEAEDILASEQKDYNETGASKIILSSAIKTIQFYGDVRLRYELRDGDAPSGAIGSNGKYVNSATHGDSEDLSRWRYRLRFGVKGDLYDDFFYGVRAATNPFYDRSGNVTFGHSDMSGEFGKSDQALVGIDQVFLGWHATSDITLIGGQMPNPFYATNMIWDDNLNPAGATEEFNHKFEDTEVFATAGQYIYQASSGNGITNTIGGHQNFPDTFMYAEQVGFKYKFDDKTFFKAAATLYTYSGTESQGNSSGSVASLYSSTPLNVSSGTNSPSFFNGPFVGAAPALTTNVSGINDLAVIEIPMEFDFTIGDEGVSSTVDPKDPKDVKVASTGWSVPIRIFSDFAYNFEADQRADQARAAILGAEGQNALGSTSTGNIGVTLANTNPTTTGMTSGDVAQNNAMFASRSFQGVLNAGKGLLDQSAYQIGIEAGQLKKKGDWDGKLYWQSTGYYAVDPNLVDADIFNAATNMQGVVVSVAHNWTDGLSSTLRYANATKVNDKLATPSVTQDLTLGDIQHYNLFQADLMWKF